MGRFALVVIIFKKKPLGLKVELLFSDKGYSKGYSPTLLIRVFIACLWCIEHETLMEIKQSCFFNIAAVVFAAEFTLFVFILKWTSLRSNNKFKIA